METRGMINNDDMPVIYDQQGLWDQNGPASSSFSIEEARCSNILDDLTRFEVASPLLQEAILSSEDVVLNTLEEGQSSGAKRKLASQTNMMDDALKKDLDTGGQSKQQIRTRSAELHNQNERIRRQKQKEKMKTLQELIPNCNKRDRSSTLDDAIKYIKSLQHKQMMSMMMMQQVGQQEMQMSSTCNPTSMQTCPPRMGIPGKFAPCFLSSNIASSCMDWTPFYYATSSSQSEQSFTWRESKARVLPSKVVQCPITKEVVDCGSSNSASNEWPRSSTARKPEEEEHMFQIQIRKGPF